MWTQWWVRTQITRAIIIMTTTTTTKTTTLLGSQVWICERVVCLCMDPSTPGSDIVDINIVDCAHTRGGLWICHFTLSTLHSVWSHFHILFNFRTKYSNKRVWIKRVCVCVREHCFFVYVGCTKNPVPLAYAHIFNWNYYAIGLADIIDWTLLRICIEWHENVGNEEHSEAE